MIQEKERENVRDCIFLDRTLDCAEGTEMEEILGMARKRGCSGQCTLEEGCKLYKTMPDGTLRNRLKEELLSWLLEE